VGTGFHPELTGRENIFLNGAILGMGKEEIKRKFDEIVAFAEVEKFLDTPVKRYSSGMYVRLAFAVAAHLEPEILIVDEVLAVGDAQFQKKCLGKMEDVAEKEGRTVLFVSHNMASLMNLCPKAILLVKGKKWLEGNSNEVISEYINTGKEAIGQQIWTNPQKAPGNDKVRFHAIKIISDGEITADVEISKDIQIVVEFWNFQPELKLSTSIHLLDKMGVYVLASSNLHSANLIVDKWFGQPHPAGLYSVVCTIPKNFLNEGMYSINAIILSDVTQTEARIDEVISFTVHENGEMRKEYGGGWIGVVRPKLAWQTEYLGSSEMSSELEKI
jgi:lipopolysaccharide transport system ATP-binding protein